MNTAFPSKEGEIVPDATFLVRENHQLKAYTSDDIFKGKKVIAFSLPGAFTPTCSTYHVPGFNDLQPVFKENGIDDIVCISVNDAFVMDQWATQQNAPRVKFLADGNGSFSEKMGALADFTLLGFGKRSLRYSMLIDDKKIVKMFIEPPKSESLPDPFLVSDAETMLKFINPNAKPRRNIAIFTKEGCIYCTRAKNLLKEKSWDYIEIPIGKGTDIPLSVLKAVSQGKPTTPQIYIDGQYIGGSDKLEQYIQNLNE